MFRTLLEKKGGREEKMKKKKFADINYYITLTDKRKITSSAQND